eukprot:m.172676 g.172676  ORF g.172676 m.172676 type:complete len:302 (-) comp25221_c0_seq6:687-1592(-)
MSTDTHQRHLQETSPLLSKQPSFRDDAKTPLPVIVVGEKTDSGLCNVVLVSIGFLVLFTAYNSLQNYVTSLLPGHLGNISLGVLYASVCFFVFLAPSIVNQLGEKKTMILGAVCYVIYMASLIKIYRPVVIAASVVIGFGAAILWVAVGVFLTRCSPDGLRGRNSGIFWGIFQLSNVLGNLGAFFFFKHVGGGAPLFTGFTIIGGAGTLFLFCLRPLPYSDAAETETPPPIGQQVRRVLSLLLTSDVRNTFHSNGRIEEEKEVRNKLLKTPPLLETSFCSISGSSSTISTSACVYFCHFHR